MERTSPESRILVNGVEIPPDLRVDVLEVAVCHHLEGGDTFEITINALDSTNNRLKRIDAREFAPGGEIEILMGYAGNLQSMIVGEITALRAEYPSDQAAILHVQGFDRLHRLRRGRRTQAYYEVKDSQVAEQIAGTMRLTPQVDDSEIVHPYLLQNNLSDVDFLLERARRIRYELLVDGQTLIFRNAANHLGHSLSLEYMRDLKSFRIRLSTAEQVSKVWVRSWNPAAKESILGSARSGDETTKMRGNVAGPDIAEQAFGPTEAAIADIPVESQAEADQIAKARFNDMAIELITGEGEAVGNMDLRAGTTVEMKGLGTRFSGSYYLKKAEHRMGPKFGYITKFSVCRNAS